MQTPGCNYMKTDLISIVMPAYNMEKFIEESIQSILKQTIQNWELIIVDDGSTDNTKKIIDAFLKSEPRIKYFYEENGKQGKARNTGIARANGNVIAFLDADDLWKNDFLEKQIALLESSHADLVFSDIQYINEFSELLPEKHAIELDELKGREGIAMMLAKNPVPLSTVIAWKQALLHAGGFKESCKLQHGEDYELWIQLLIHGCTLQGNNENLVLYRKHPWQSTVINESKYFQRIEIIQRIPVSIGVEKEKRNAISRWILRKLINSKNAGKEELKNDAGYLPTGFQKKSSLIACSLFPASFARKVMCLISNI